MNEYISDKERNRLFIDILNRPENCQCADCESKGPVWVSLHFGVFVCMKCVGEHRRLGMHITRPMSTKLDKWRAEEVCQMEGIGNIVANAYWECNRPGSEAKPSSSASMEARRRYINKKYIKKLWVDRKGNDPVSEYQQALIENRPMKVSTVKKQKGANLKLFVQKEKKEIDEVHSIPDLMSFSPKNPEGLVFEKPSLEKSQSTNPNSLNHPSNNEMNLFDFDLTATAQQNQAPATQSQGQIIQNTGNQPQQNKLDDFDLLGGMGNTTQQQATPQNNGFNGNGMMNNNAAMGMRGPMMGQNNDRYAALNMLNQRQAYGGGYMAGYQQNRGMMNRGMMGNNQGMMGNRGMMGNNQGMMGNRGMVQGGFGMNTNISYGGNGF